MLCIYIIIIFWNKLVKIVEHNCLSIQWQATPFCKRQDLWSYRFVECKNHFVEKTQKTHYKMDHPDPTQGMARRICNSVLCYRIMLVIFCCEKGKKCLQIDRANLMLGIPRLILYRMNGKGLPQWVQNLRLYTAEVAFCREYKVGASQSTCNMCILVGGIL